MKIRGDLMALMVEIAALDLPTWACASSDNILAMSCRRVTIRP